MNTQVILDITVRLLHSYLCDAQSQGVVLEGSPPEVYEALRGNSNGQLAEFEAGVGGDRLMERTLLQALYFFEDTTNCKYLTICPDFHKHCSRILTRWPDERFKCEERRDRFGRAPAVQSRGSLEGAGES